MSDSSANTITMQVLIDGPQTHHSMLDAIASAEDCVQLVSYRFATDTTGKRFVQSLRDCISRGVTVSVVFDGFGSSDSDLSVFDSLRADGAEVLHFSPLEPQRGEEWLPGDLRDHRKLLIVDESVAFIGGVNISDKYAESSDGKSDEVWRDSHLRLEGAAVRKLADAERSVRERMTAANGSPEFDPPGVQIDLNADITAILLEGRRKRSLIVDALQEAIDSAAQRIWITQAYFVPPDDFLDSLVQAARRGVDVRILLPLHTDHEVTRYASQQVFSLLLEAGVRVFTFENSLLHAKVAIVDGSWCSLGSSNLDNMSICTNLESNLLIRDRDVVDQLCKQFRKDIECSDEMDPRRWAKRSAWQRLRSWFAFRLRDWL